MKTLWDINHNLLDTDNQKAEGPRRDHFVQNKEERKWEEKEEKTGYVLRLR